MSDKALSPAGRRPPGPVLQPPAGADAGAWQVVSSELLRIMRRIDEIDSIIRILDPLLAGFHDVDPAAGSGTLELFAIGANQRARLDRLEGQIDRLAQKVDQLQNHLNPGAAA